MQNTLQSRAKLLGVLQSFAVKKISPAFSQFLDASGIESCRAGSEFAAFIAPEILPRYVCKVNLGESHWKAFFRGFGLCVHLVNENSHPLFTSAMGVNGTTLFPRCLDFHAFDSGF